MRASGAVAALLCALFLLWACAVAWLARQNRTRDNAFNRAARRATSGKLDDPRWTRFVDKHEFKELCRELGIPTLRTIAVFDDLDELRRGYDELPSSFILKSTKGSGRNLAVRDKRSWKEDGVAEALADYDRGYSPHMLYPWIPRPKSWFSFLLRDEPSTTTLGRGSLRKSLSTPPRRT